MLVEQAMAKVHAIYKALESDANPPSNSLMGGDPGIILFKSLYGKYYPSDIDYDSLSLGIQHLAEISFLEPDPSFCNGRSGINWVFRYLTQAGILEEGMDAFLDESNSLLMDASVKMMEQNNYDYLHGSLGIAYSLLYSHPRAYMDYYSLVLERLEEIIVIKGFLPYYTAQTEQDSPEQVNFGLAHGLPGVLKFCLQCYNAGILVEKSKKIMDRVLVTLRSYRNAQTDYSYFPAMVAAGSETESRSRLAWCYGDLSLAFILYQYALVFKDKEIEDFAIEVLEHTTRRRTYDLTSVRDAGICHGSAGIAYLYNKLYHLTGNDSFKESGSFWLQQTLDYATNEDGLAGYKSYNGIKQEYEPSPGLLEGIAGIGLVLLNFLTSDFSWDYCLLLN